MQKLEVEIEGISGPVLVAVASVADSTYEQLVKYIANKTSDDDLEHGDFACDHKNKTVIEYALNQIGFELEEGLHEDAPKRLLSLLEKAIIAGAELLWVKRVGVHYGCE